MTWRDIGSADAVPAGGNRTLVGVTVFNHDGRWHACETRCPHMGHPMAKGSIRDGVITCAWHKWEFDLDGGGCYRGGTDDLVVFPIRIDGGRIQIDRGEALADDGTGARRLREAMMSGDAYLQAKAVARLAAAGADARAIVAAAAPHWFRHSLQAHQDPQAAVELQHLLDAAELAAVLPASDLVQALMLGLRGVGSGTTDRALVETLPPPRRPEHLLGRLGDYVRDPSPLGLERILRTLDVEGVDAMPTVFALATSACFVPHPAVARAVSTARQARALLGPAFAGEAQAMTAWALGIERAVPDAEEREAIDWLEARSARLATLGAGAGEVTVDQAATLLAAPGIAAALDLAAAWLAGGASHASLRDALSVLFARRFARLKPNNGGLWRTATAGLDRCATLRRDDDIAGAYRLQGLFALVVHCYRSRWLPDPQPMPADETDGGDWTAYEHAVAAGDIDGARRTGLAALAREPDRAAAAARWVGPLAREDLGGDQLRTLVAVIDESHRQREWQPYVAGMITYALDAKQGRTVEAAARFGQSFA